MQKSKIKWPIIIIVIIGLIIMYFGGKTMIEDKAMRDFVHSKVATEAIWDTIKLEEEIGGTKNVVKKFTIMEKTISRNPINGYGFRIYLNDDKEMMMGIGLTNFGTPNKTWEADPSPGPKAEKLMNPKGKYTEGND